MKGSLLSRFATMTDWRPAGLTLLTMLMMMLMVCSATAVSGFHQPANGGRSSAIGLHADDSKISRIRPHADAGDDETGDYLGRQPVQLQQHHQQQRRRLHPQELTLTGVPAKSPKSVDGRKLSNHEVLRSLGLAKMNIPSSHHRKRLAVESRHHARPDDSHMYIIKLPPNPVYYTKTSGSDRNAIDDTKKKFNVDFMSNGKPGRIYHWNLPILKRMLSQEGGGSSSRSTSKSRLSNDISELIDIRHIPTWTKPWENDTGEKTYRKNDRLSTDDSMLLAAGGGGGGPAKKSPTYYAPRPKKSSSNGHKYFPGNGKPKSFYVFKGKSQQPHYQKLIP